MIGGTDEEKGRQKHREVRLNCFFSESQDVFALSLLSFQCK